MTDGGEITHSYSVKSNNKVKTTMHEIIEMIHRASFESLKRETVNDPVETVGI